MPNNTLTRKVNTRQIKSVQDTELNSLKSEITSHINDIKSKAQFRALFINTTDSNEVKIKEFISRAQIVWICATLDYYLHKIQSICMFKIYNKQIAQTQFCKKINVPFDIVIDLSNGNSNNFTEGVYESLKCYSYMNMKSIKNVTDLIGIKIKQVAKAVYPSESTLKKAYEKLSDKLEEIFHRRHIIVHKMDIEKGQIQTITDALVDEYIDVIEKFIFNMHNLVENLI